MRFINNPESGATDPLYNGMADSFSQNPYTDSLVYHILIKKVTQEVNGVHVATANTKAEIHRSPTSLK